MARDASRGPVLYTLRDREADRRRSARLSASGALHRHCTARRDHVSRKSSGLRTHTVGSTFTNRSRSNAMYPDNGVRRGLTYFVWSSFRCSLTDHAEEVVHTHLGPRAFTLNLDDPPFAVSPSLNVDAACLRPGDFHLRPPIRVEVSFDGSLDC